MRFSSLSLLFPFLHPNATQMRVNSSPTVYKEALTVPYTEPYTLCNILESERGLIICYPGHLRLKWRQTFFPWKAIYYRVHVTIWFTSHWIDSSFIPSLSFALSFSSRWGWKKCVQILHLKLTQSWAEKVEWRQNWKSSAPFSKARREREKEEAIEQK